MSTEQDDSWRDVLAISVQSGGPEAAWFDSVVGVAARALRAANDLYAKTSTDPSLVGRITVLFEVDGSIWPVDYSGVKAGRLTKADRGLVVRFGVVDRTVDAAQFVADALLAAVPFAERRFAQRHVEVDLTLATLVATHAAAALVRESVDDFDGQARCRRLATVALSPPR